MTRQPDYVAVPAKMYADLRRATGMLPNDIAISKVGEELKKWVGWRHEKKARLRGQCVGRRQAHG